MLWLFLCCNDPRPHSAGGEGDSAASTPEGDSPGPEDSGEEGTICPPTGVVVRGGELCISGAPGRLVGANGMHVFGPGSEDMASWGLGLSREFIGNMDEQPIDGWPLQDSRGSWLHPLRDVVEDNRAHGLLTLLSPMGWDGEELIYASEPSEVPWRSDYDERLAAIAAAFAEDPDVWISVWNEPYDWTGEGFSEDRWLEDINSLVAVVRGVGFSGVIALPGSHMGQGAEVWISHGALVDDPLDNHIFDLHAYERWLLERSPTEAEEELDQLDQAGLCWMVGEIAPYNAGEPMDPRSFLQLPPVQRRSLSAWLWKYSDSDPDALLRADGSPNDLDNAQWGSTWRSLAAGEPLPEG
jgi:mannan endo-1,4-beta-mannosidase